jgi:membrane fusion protein (multidrug efflux system)
LIGKHTAYTTGAYTIITLFLISTVIPALLAFIGCTNEKAEKSSGTKNVPSVEIKIARLEKITRSIELTGTVEAARIARIASHAEGPVIHCSVREGDTVKNGAIILTIGRKRAAEELVEAAEKVLAREKEDLKRIEQLVSSGAVPAEQLEEAQLRVYRARAELTNALESMEDYRIRAPWTGIVSKVYVTDGYFVSPRETLLEIFDPNTLVIRFAVPEKEANNVHVGMEIPVTLDTYGNRPFHAKITRLYPELDRNMHTRTVEASLMENIPIVPGMFARLSVPVQTINDAVIIPDRAIMITPQGERVIFVLKNGKAFSQEVTIGIEQQQTVQITEGVSAGDSVIVSGSQTLQNGAKVSILERETFQDQGIKKE